MPAPQEIRDPVHNFINFDEFEKRIINSVPMQRLKRIKQLALTHEVYPGASHSRFEHSLGTMELATQAFDTIVSKDPESLRKLNWSTSDRELYRQLLRLGAMLHDIGHAPFSHAPEGLLPEGLPDHEAFTEALIESSHIRPLLSWEVRNFDPAQVVAVALGPEKRPQENPSLQLLQELVAGDLGVDRMDYLVRDALHTGATAGRFDYHRLLNTLTVIEHPVTGSPVLAIEAGGRYAAEGLLLARFFMFRQVYFHHVRRIYDIHLLDFLRSYLPGGKFPANVDEYLRLDDNLVTVEIVRAASSGESAGELARRLLNRGHYRLVYEMPFSLRERSPDLFHELKERVASEFEDAVRADEVGKESHTLEEGRLFIVHSDGHLEDILQVSEIIQYLKPVWSGRIYAGPDVVADVAKSCEAFVKEVSQ